MNGKTLAANVRADFKARKPAVMPAVKVILLFGTLLAIGTGAVVLQLDNYIRAKGLTHYDRVQMDRLLNTID